MHAEITRVHNYPTDLHSLRGLSRLQPGCAERGGRCWLINCDFAGNDKFIVCFTGMYSWRAGFGETGMGRGSEAVMKVL